MDGPLGHPILKLAEYDLKRLSAQLYILTAILVLSTSCLVSEATAECSSRAISQVSSLEIAQEIAANCPNSASVQHATGLRLARAGRHSEALECLEAAARLAPKDLSYRTDLIVVLCWAGRYQDAMLEYRKLPSSYHGPIYLYRNAAQAAYNQNDFSLAYRLYGEWQKRDPDDNLALRGLIFSICKLGRYQEGRDCLARAVSTHPELQKEAKLLSFYMLCAQKRFWDAYMLLCEIRNQGEDATIWFDVWETAVTSASPKAISDLVRDMSTKDAPLKDRFLIAALRGRHETALDLAQQVDTTEQRAWPMRYRAWLGWSFFKRGKTEESIAVYEKMLQDSRKNRPARIGIVYCLASQGEYNRAHAVLKELMAEAPGDVDTLFALAFWHEKKKEFLDAVLTYEKILDIKPRNHNARKLRLRALSDLGLPSLSIEQIGELKSDIQFSSDLELDEAAYFLRWELAEDAIATERPLLLSQPDNRRALFDYMLALRQQEYYSEVKKEYEELLKKGIVPSYWVIEAAADAYLEQDDPEKAVELYRRILEQHPKSFKARMGLFYALQELRQWRSAWDLLGDIDQDTSPGRKAGRRFIPNWRKYEVGIARGWLLAYENRLQEAETYFKELNSSAPANTGIRTGLGHVYMWRGWPRLALEELSIAISRNPNEIGAVNGKAIVMNELGFETDARNLASALYEQYPQNRHVQRLITELDVDDMREMVTDIVIDLEDDDSSDLYFRTEVNEKIAPQWRIYQYILLQNVEYRGRSEAYRRIGLGLRHRFNPEWYWEEDVSFDFWDHADFGISTSFTYTPDDYWAIEASYDTYSTNMPLRARAAGADSDEVSLGITYRESEWRAYSLSFNTMDFSDGNRRNSGLVQYEQGLWVKGDWMARLYLDCYASHNSKEDMDYFNPHRDMSISATHMLQGTHYRHFGKSFVQRLFLTAGGYYQEGHGTHTIGAIRYEQDFSFSFRSVFLWGATLARRVYDGDPATALSLYLTFKYRF